MKTLIPLFILCLFFSCKPVKTITKTETRDSLVYKTRYDSIFFHVKDSIYIREKNDTIIIEKWKISIKDKIVLKTDTIIQTNTFTDIQYVEKKSGKLRSFLQYCGIMFWILLILVVWRIVKRNV